MGCDEALEIVNIPADLREPGERAALKAHLEQCGDCRARGEAFERGVTRFLQEPAPAEGDAAITAMLKRVRADRRADPVAAGIGREGSPARRGEFSWRQRWRERWRQLRGALWVPAALAVAALLLIRAPWPGAGVRDDVRDNVRDGERGGVESAGLGGVRSRGAEGGAPRPFVDLQASIERGGGRSPVQVMPADNDARFGADDGLVFQFMAGAAGQLVLIESDPVHRLKVVYQSSEQTLRRALPQLVRITGATGRPLRYQPDGPPGDYTYVAVALTQPVRLDAAELDAIWSQYVRQVVGPIGSPPDYAPALDALRVHFDGPEGAREPAAVSSPDPGEAP